MNFAKNLSYRGTSPYLSCTTPHRTQGHVFDDKVSPLDWKQTSFCVLLLFLVAIISPLEIGPIENVSEAGTRKATINLTVLLTNTGPRQLTLNLSRHAVVCVEDDIGSL